MRRLFALLLCCAVTSTASAHSPIEGVGAFYNGTFHPAMVLPHLLLILALGIWSGCQGRRHARFGVMGFALGLLAGLLLTAYGSAPDMTDTLLILVVLACLGIIWMQPLPVWLPVGLAVAAGIGIGLDSPAEGTDRAERALMMAGTWLGGSIILLQGAILPLVLKQAWVRIGFRILAAWGAAASFLVWVMVLI